MGKKESFNNPKVIMDLPADAKLVGSVNNKKIVSELPQDAKLVDTSDSNPYMKQLELEQNFDQFNDIIKNIPDLDDSKKETIRELAQKGVKGEELSNSILTLQGKHPHQNDSETGITNLKGTSSKYYFNDKGLPVPLKSNERPPPGYEVASIWGTQQEANDDNTITSLGKHLWNGVVGAAEGIASLPELAYRSTTGNESDWFHKIQNNAELIKFKTPDYENKPLYNFEGIKDYEDLFTSDRWIPNADALQGVVFGGLETGLSFILGTKGLGAVGKLAGTAGKASGLLKAGTLVDETGQILNKGSQLTNFIEGTSNVGKLGQAYTTSYVQNYNEAYDAATEAGLEGSDKLAFAGLATIPIAMLEVAFGTEGLLTKNMMAKSARKEMYKKLGEGVIKDGKGNITKESLEKLFKESVINGTRLNKSFVRELGETMIEEGLTEGAQAITLETAKEIYDKVSKDQKFNTEVFSPENVGEYINNILSGGIGAMGIGAYGVNQQRKIEKEEVKKNNAFEVVKSGQINNFNKNVNLAFENGDISQEDAEAAKFKVRTYQEYYDQTKNLNLNDDNKKRLFELSFEKQNLESQIPTQYEEDKLNPIAQAEINIRKEEAKVIQKEINELLKNNTIVNKTTTTAKKIIEDVDKSLSPDTKQSGDKASPKRASSISDLLSKFENSYGKEINEVQNTKKEEPELRNFDAIPFKDWNQKKDDEKFRIYSEHLDTNKQSQVGEIYMMKGGDGRTTNDTIHIKLPNDKFVIFASSATNLKTGNRGYLHTEHLPKDFDGHKVVVKPKRLTTGRIVLPVYNAETGKPIGYVREDNKGKAAEKLFLKRMEKIGEEEALQIQDKENDELQHILTESLTTNEIEALSRPDGENQPSTQVVKNKTTPETKPIKEENVINTTNEQSNTTTTEGDTVTQTESGTGNDEEVSSEVQETSATKLRIKGKPRHKRKIKEPIRLKALEIEANTPYDLALQFFIKNGLVEGNDLLKYFKGDSKEKSNRWSLWSYKHGLTRDEIAHEIWENNSELKYDTSDYLDAVEEVLSGFENRTDMAQDLVNRWKEKINPMEQAVSEEFTEAEKQGVEETFSDIVNEAEGLGNDEIEKMANDDKLFDVWGNEIKDIIRKEDLPDDMFQKPKEPQDYKSWKRKNVTYRGVKEMGQTNGSDAMLGRGLYTAHLSNKSLAKDYGKVYFVVNARPKNPIKFDTVERWESWFDDLKFNKLGYKRLSEFNKNTTIEDEIQKLGYDGVEINGREIVNYRPENVKYFESEDELQKHYDDITSSLQKQKASNPSLEAEKHKAVLKVTKRIQEVLPGIKVIYDKKMKAAGKWSPPQKVLSINPYFAGIDTPIHEAGHILIDVLGGVNNKVVVKAINQLKTTDLWAETKERYPELSEEQLGYEVLAEAIGREGEGIFDKEVEKNKFLTYLEYLFNQLKQLLGLDKNVAKSLAQQIIWGIGLESNEFNIADDQLQKPKEDEGKGSRAFTLFEDKTREQQVKALTLSFEQYSREVLKRDVISEAENLKKINDALENPDLTEEDKDQLELVKEAISQRKKQDLFSWFKYKEDIKLASIINYDVADLEASLEKGDLNEQEYLDGMIALYNVVTGMQETARKTVESNVMNKLSYALFQNQKTELKKNEKFVEEIANKADMSAKDVWLKNLGHVTEKVPELQAFGKIYDEATFDKVTEAKEKKNTFEKLGTAVIKEKNKQLGITGTVKSLFSSDSAKYFDWIDNGDGEMITVDEAENKGLSKAHIEFLKYYRELVAENQELKGDVYNAPMQVLKTDPTFKETFKQDGITQAFSNFLGTNYNLKQIRIPFTDPETNQKSIHNFGDIENKLIGYGKKGIIEKAKALALILKYNRQARIQLKKGVNADEKDNPLYVKNNSIYSINSKGVLTSKFDRPRDKNRGYSKDFYRAGIEFIDDLTHVKHMSKLVPIINSIEYLNQHGYAEHLAKPNVAKWIKEWKDLHIFKNPKETLPEIDVMLRFLRFVTSATTMMFNVPAGVMNLGMGLYNNWRAETDAWRAKGHGRLFLKGGRKVNKDYAFGFINPKAVDILRKYNIVSTDYDSNPKVFAGRVFDRIAHALTRYGEFQIQGTNFLGQLTDEEWNSFEYKTNKHGIDELVLKEGVDEKALKNKFITYKNKVSDIQGKYGEADMRNFTNSEMGKAAAQFKNWMPDWWRMRFGERYIDRNGETKQGSWRVFVGEGLDDLRNDIQEKGYIKAFWENKDFMSNLKGAMVTVMFMALAHQDDEDEKRRKGAIDAQNALSQLLFVFDTNQLKFTISRPIAAVGTIEKFIDAAQHLKDLDADKLEKDVIKLTPLNKIVKTVDMFE